MLARGLQLFAEAFHLVPIDLNVPVVNLEFTFSQFQPIFQLTEVFQDGGFFLADIGQFLFPSFYFCLQLIELRFFIFQEFFDLLVRINLGNTNGRSPYEKGQTNNPDRGMKKRASHL